MVIIECPDCKAKVDVDRGDVEEQKRGLELIDRCPECKERLIVLRVGVVLRVG
jgi:hypothetical protein